jgi:hypothetical protein
MADYWLKLYIEILDDPKMATLPDRVWRRVIELFLVAKRLGKEGHLPDTRQIAWMLRMSPDELEHDMKQISTTGIVTQEVGGWFIPKFKSRQEAVPAKERMAEMRERNQKQQYYGNVTSELRNVTQSTEYRLTEDREQNTEAEQKELPDPFSVFQIVLESNGIPPQTPADIKAIADMVSMGAVKEDLLNGISWKAQNNNGQPIRYVSQVVNPTRTAMQIRLQNGSGHKSTKKDPVGEWITNAAGERVFVEARQ